MNRSQFGVSRRGFLGSAAGLAATSLLGRAPFCRADDAPAQVAKPKVDVAFWQVSDTHLLADVDDLSRLDEMSSSINEEVVRLLNTLPGTELPPNVGGGALPKPVAVIHTGDVIDSGNKYSEPFVEMQRTEWRAYLELYGLTGVEGKLKFPVYELYGNHDAPEGRGLALEHMAERNPKRPNVSKISKNGVHYSWDWGPIHVVSLGINVGATDRTPRKRSFNALESFEFLKTNLAEKVGQSGRPVILCHHVDFAGHSTGCKPEAKNPPGRVDWDPCDVAAYYDAIKGYNVIACIYGHTHQRNVFQWDGKSAKAEAGINSFNCDDAGHFKAGAHGILHYHVTDTTLTVREFATKDHWKTAAWTQMWQRPIEMAKATPAAGADVECAACGRG
jgi:cytolysin (calcineurin-like family phosphatase)